jgi:hypothetical protein
MKQCRIECWGDAERYSLRAVQLRRFPVVSSVRGPFEMEGPSIVSFKCGNR